ncbi:MAG: glycerol kinase GlpK [Oscillospiraceae bacterium]|nr:glycerol kinase GlpK [Oscillospiraceae bacterium]
MARYILAADQGTTSSRAILFDEDQNIVAVSQREFTQYYPKEGWVEHDAIEIYLTQLSVMQEVVTRSGVDPHDIAAIGITNQRETVVVWDRETGIPVCNAIVWQCRRTADICEELEKKGLSDYIRQTTGLLIDAYFSGTKIKWILDNVPGAREKAESGKLICGTIDSWLLYKFTGGKVHMTDRTNASRTMLYDIRRQCWDDRLLKELDIPRSMLPEVRSSSEIYGYMDLNGVSIPIAGIAGDQQSALYGQTCFEKGDAKNTYGTGCFTLMNIGDEIVYSKNGLVTTVAATGPDRVSYALEGSVFVAGAVVQWLRDEMGLVEKASDTEFYAKQVPDTAGVYIVPAFTGLGAPYWDMYARGTIVGLTRGANRNHIIRAALESIAYQTNSVLHAMEADIGYKLTELKVDGGASANDFLMQFQSDITGIDIIRPRTLETTALGAACLVGLAVGIWKDEAELRSSWAVEKTFSPQISAEKRERMTAGFDRAVERSNGWAKQEDQKSTS